MKDLLELRGRPRRTCIRSKCDSLCRFGDAMFFAGLVLCCFPGAAQTVSPPDVVKLPGGLNLGSTSFYDGFARTDPGLAFIDYPRWSDFNSIRDSGGHNSPQFVDPRIYVFSNVFQLWCATPLTLGNGVFALDALLPIVDYQSHFGASGVVLHDNGFDVGDLTFGPAYQSKPVLLDGRPIFSWRLEFDVIAPIGGFNSKVDINQSSGYWSLNPFFAVSVLPLPKWEMSARFNFLHNFETDRASNPPSLPGYTFHDGQAGQAGWINFASSYDLWHGIRPGINGFWLQQANDDRSNGVSVPGTREEQLYLGPGMSWQINKKNILNANLYLLIAAKNTPAGPQLNFQYIHTF